MGFRTSWIATRGLDGDALIAALGHERTGRTEDFVDTGVWLLALASGFSVVVASGSEHVAALRPAHAAALSVGRDVLYFWQSDTSMGSELRRYRDGAQVFCASYDGAAGPSRPTVEGAIPAEYAALDARRAAQQEQARDAASPHDAPSVDHRYEVLADLGEALVGFRHDRDPDVRGPIAQLAPR